MTYHLLRDIIFDIYKSVVNEEGNIIESKQLKVVDIFSLVKDVLNKFIEDWKKVLKNILVLISNYKNFFPTVKIYSRNEVVLWDNQCVKYEELEKIVLSLPQLKIIKLFNDSKEMLYFCTIENPADGDCYYYSVCRSKVFRKVMNKKYFSYYDYNLRRDITQYVLDK